MKLTLENVEEVLKKVRPFLQIDGGDVEVLNIVDNEIVKISLKGACKNCPLSMMTLRAGIERALMEEIPSVKRIEAVN